jgi:chemotaxis protein CheC
MIAQADVDGATPDPTPRRAADTVLGEALLAGLFSRAMRKAGDALAEMSGHAITVEAPAVRHCDAAGVIQLAGGPDAVVVGVYLGITGSVTGHALLMLSVDGARRLAAVLLDGMLDASEPTVDEFGLPVFDPLEMSALQELGNVTVGAFLNELGMHLHEPVQPTVPQALIEFSGSILDAVLADVAADAGEILAAQTRFIEGDRGIDGTILVLPHPQSLLTLLAAMGAIG